MEIKPSRNGLFGKLYDNGGVAGPDIRIGLVNDGRWPLEHKFLSGNPHKDNGDTVYYPSAKDVNSSEANLEEAVDELSPLKSFSPMKSVVRTDTGHYSVSALRSDTSQYSVGSDAGVAATMKHEHKVAPSASHSTQPEQIQEKVSFWAVSIPGGLKEPQQLGIRMGLDFVRALGSPTANIFLYCTKPKFDPTNPFHAGRMATSLQLLNASSFQTGGIIGHRITKKDIVRFDTVYAHNTSKEYEKTRALDFKKQKKVMTMQETMRVDDLFETAVTVVREYGLNQYSVSSREQKQQNLNEKTDDTKESVVMAKMQNTLKERLAKRRSNDAVEGIYLGDCNVDFNSADSSENEAESSKANHQDRSLQEKGKSEFDGDQLITLEFSYDMKGGE